LQIKVRNWRKSNLKSIRKLGKAGRSTGTKNYLFL